MSATEVALQARLGEVLRSFGVEGLVDEPTFARLVSMLAYAASDEERIAAGPSPSDLLRFLGKARADYYRGPEPQTASDLAAMRPDDLTIWVEAKTAEQLAGYLEDPDRAWGWLPSWRSDEWKALSKPAD